jgi:RNA polymerase-binding transcription factor
MSAEFHERCISIKAPWPSHPVCIGASFPPFMDTGGYRASLEELWRQKVDQIVVLSIAYHDDLPSDSAADSPPGLARTDARLMRCVMRAHEDLALIEDAIDRIKAGTYGICGSCEQPISTDWLAETPYVRDCPDCCLSQTSSRLAVIGPRSADSLANAG